MADIRFTETLWGREVTNVSDRTVYIGTTADVTPESGLPLLPGHTLDISRIEGPVFAVVREMGE